MKKIYTVLFCFSFSIVFAQGNSSNLRRVNREVEKIMSLTSDIIDGVMTYEKSKKLKPLIEEQFSTWRKSKRSIARLNEPEEAPLVAASELHIGDIVELTSAPLVDWLNEDPRSDFGHEYVAAVEQHFAALEAVMDEYAETYEINLRESKILERYNKQMELFAYTKEMKAGANEVDSLVSFLQEHIGTTDLEPLYSAQKLLIKGLSHHIRGYGDEQFYNGQTELHEAYQKYYMELLELTSADLLADLTKMKYDLVEYNEIASSTAASASRTLSFFDNELKLLAKREARFVKKNLPKPPKKK